MLLWEYNSCTLCGIIFSIFVECLLHCLLYRAFCHFSCDTVVATTGQVLYPYTDTGNIFTTVICCQYDTLLSRVSLFLFAHYSDTFMCIIEGYSRSLHSFSRGHPYVRQTVRGSVSVTGNSNWICCSPQNLWFTWHTISVSIELPWDCVFSILFF